MRAFLLVTLAGLAQYLLWFAVKSRDAPDLLFGPGADPQLALTVLLWGAGLAILAATLSLGLVALVAPRRRGPAAPKRLLSGPTLAALGLASLMIGGLMLMLARA